MSQTSEVGNQDRYKSYIQRRRVSFDNFTNDSAAESKTDKSPINDIADMSLINEHKTYEGFFSHSKGINDKDTYDSYNTYSHRSNFPNHTDKSIYQRKSPGSYGASNRTAIEENRSTLLAIKIIKQALTCFAILGIIVLLQQRSDTGTVLNYIKSQVVENHTEISGLVSEVENIITECSGFFGGSP